MTDHIERERNRRKEVVLLGDRETDEFLDEEIASTYGPQADSTRTQPDGLRPVRKRTRRSGV